VGLATAVLTLVGAGAAQARPAYDATLLRITAPTDERLVRGGSVTVRAVARRGVRRVRVSVDGRDVSKRLRRDGGMYSARVSLRGLGAGPHRLLVTATAPGRHDADSVTVFTGRRVRSLVDVRTMKPSDGLAVPLRVRVPKRARRVEVTVNGRHVERGLWPLLGAVRRGELSASTGLRYGPNVLRAFALQPDGSYDVARNVVRVPRTRPLPSAGRNRRATVGVRVRPSARGSRATRPGRRLSYAWNVIRAPRGSKADLRRARAARPVFVPDKRGVYRLRLRVSERRPGRRGRAAQTVASSDTVVLEAGPQMEPIGWAIDTLATQGSQTGIDYDGGFAPNLGTPDSLQILVFDRGTLATYETPNPNNYDLSNTQGVSALTTALTNLQDSSLVVLAGGASMSSSTLPGVNAALAQIGVPPLPAGSDGPFSAIGVPGAAAGSMFLNPRGALTGYISPAFVPAGPPTDGQPLPDPIDKYTFTYAEYQPFNLSSTLIRTGQINLGPTSLEYVTEDSGAIAAAVVDAQFLTVGSSDVFRVNNADPNVAAAEQQRLTEMLQAYVGNPFALVAVQSLGQVSAAQTTQWRALSGALGDFGATEHLVNTINGGYSFLGGPGFKGEPAEASTNQSGLANAQLNGILGYNNEYTTYEPLLHDQLPQDASFNYELLPIVYEDPQPWPHDGDPQWEAAYDWIGQAVGVDDIRAQYVGNENIPWSDIYTNLTSSVPAQCPAGMSDFTQEICQQQAAELAQEIEWLQTIEKFIVNIKSPLAGSSGVSYAELNATFGSVAQSVQVSESPDLAAEVLDIVSEGFDLLSFVGGEDVEPVLAIFGSATGIGGAIATNSDGSAILSTLQYDVTQLGLQLEDSYVNTLLSYDQIEAILLSDYGKLSGIGAAALGGDPEWTWSGANPNTTADGLQALEASTNRWSWGELMPVAWPVWEVGPLYPDGQPVSPLAPSGFICTDDGGEDAFPFNGTPSTAWFLADLGPNDASPAGSQMMWVIAKNGSSSTNRGAAFHIPSGQLTNTMNDSFYANQLLQAQFWAREFEPQSLGRASYFLDGCDYNGLG
jgi:hypothetical protein